MTTGIATSYLTSHLSVQNLKDELFILFELDRLLFFVARFKGSQSTEAGIGLLETFPFFFVETSTFSQKRLTLSRLCNSFPPIYLEGTTFYFDGTVFVFF